MFKRIHDVTRLVLTSAGIKRGDRKTIIVPNRRHSRDMSRAQITGVHQFTRAANARSRAAARAKNKQARASRKRNRV